MKFRIQRFNLLIFLALGEVTLVGSPQQVCKHFAQLRIQIESWLVNHVSRTWCNMYNN